ncbi:MAG TPA: hypothetical protein VHA77_16065 [Xanthobacteraceae bacterium]|jgi:hypothetical protein|nr:hypothetical protein [Xanthobacteraceae bacterium]
MARIRIGRPISDDPGQPRRRLFPTARRRWRHFIDDDGPSLTIWLCKFALLCGLMFLTVAGLAKLDRMTRINSDSATLIDAAALARH